MTLVAYLLRADLRQRWRQLLILAVLVAIVVGAVLAATAGSGRTRTAFDRYLDSVRPVDAIVFSTGEPLDPKSVERIDGVEAAIGFHWFAVFPKGGPDGFFFIPMFVPSDRRVPNTYQRAPLVAGRLPDPGAPLEIALGERTARRLGVGVGDTYPAVTFTAAGLDSEDAAPPRPDGPDLIFEVVGIVRTAGDVSSREQDVDANLLTPAFATTYEDQIALFESGAMVVAAPGASTEQVRANLQSLGPIAIEDLMSPEVLRRQADPTLAAMATGLRVVALIVGLLGGLAIAQALARAATDRIGDNGETRSLGASRPVLLLHLTLPSVCAGTVGVLAGAALAVASSRFVLWGLARRAEVTSGVQIDLPVLVIGMLGAVSFITVMSILVSQAAMGRDRRTGATPAPSALVSRAARAGASVTVVSGLRLALERGRGHRATPVVAAAAAAAIGAIGLMATVVFASSLHHAEITPSVYGWSWDGLLIGTDNGDDLADDAALGATLAEDTSFTAVAGIVNDLEVTVDGAPYRAIELQDFRGHTPFVIARGREPLGLDEVGVGAQTLEELGLQLHDTIDVGAGGPTRALTIVGVAVLPVGEDGGSSARGLGMRREAAEAIGFSGSCDGAECSRHVVVTAAAGVDVETAIRPYLTESISFTHPAAPGEVERLRAVDGVPRVLAVVLGAIAVLAVTHAAATTVRRRRFDLAMLRVLGLYSGQLRRAVTVQVAVLALGGALVGVALGTALGRLLWAAVADSVPLPVVFAFPIAALVLVPLGIVVLAQAGASLSRRSAGRVRPAIALRNE